MLEFLKSRRQDEDGAVSVDWVVLTAAIVGLAAGGAAVTLAGVDAVGNHVQSDLQTQSVK